MLGGGAYLRKGEGLCSSHNLRRPPDEFQETHLLSPPIGSEDDTCQPRPLSQRSADVAV